jgi:predicted DNA-binding transcriptional regulator AlpA
MDRRTTARLRREQGHLNVTEVAGLLGVNKFTFYNWVNQGLIPKPTITFTGRRRYYSARDVDRLRREVGGGQQEFAESVISPNVQSSEVTS